MNTKRAVCGLLFHNNKILSVSSKSNHSDFNLFGGKLENGETGLAVVKFLSPSELTEGAFGDYNKALFKHFNITD